MHRNKINISTHFKIQYKNEIIFFYKIYIDFPYLKKTLKNLEKFSLKNFFSPNIISYTTFIINYLS